MSGAIRLAAVGDVGLIGVVREGIERHGPGWLLESVSPLFADVDVSLFNLEMPFALPDAPRRGEVREGFRVPPSTVAALRFPGVRIACLANNHVTDFGKEGLATTLATLREVGILTVGADFTPEAAGALCVAEIRGVRLGVLGFAQPGPHTEGHGGWVAAAHPEAVLASVKKARPAVDVLVVNLHHGATYVDLPTPQGRDLARAVARAGADLVVGHHPHVVQGVERVGRACVAHSLGEFIFDGTVGHVLAKEAQERRRQSFVVLAHLGADSPVEVERHPTVADAAGRPSSPDRTLLAAMQLRFAELDHLLQRPDYAAAFNENAAKNLAGHELRVLKEALRRLDLGYLIRKLSRIRLRHLSILFTRLRTRGR